MRPSGGFSGLRSDDTGYWDRNRATLPSRMEVVPGPLRERRRPRPRPRSGRRRPPAVLPVPARPGCRLPDRRRPRPRGRGARPQDAIRHRGARGDVAPERSDGRSGRSGRRRLLAHHRSHVDRIRPGPRTSVVAAVVCRCLSGNPWSKHVAIAGVLALSGHCSRLLPETQDRLYVGTTRTSLPQSEPRGYRATTPGMPCLSSTRHVFLRQFSIVNASAPNTKRLGHAVVGIGDCENACDVPGPLWDIRLLMVLATSSGPHGITPTACSALRRRRSWIRGCGSRLPWSGTANLHVPAETGTVPTVEEHGTARVPIAGSALR